MLSSPANRLGGKERQKKVGLDSLSLARTEASRGQKGACCETIINREIEIVTMEACLFLDYSRTWLSHGLREATQFGLCHSGRW